VYIQSRRWIPADADSASATCRRQVRATCAVTSSPSLESLVRPGALVEVKKDEKRTFCRVDSPDGKKNWWVFDQVCPYAVCIRFSRPAINTLTLLPLPYARCHAIRDAQHVWGHCCARMQHAAAERCAIRRNVCSCMVAPMSAIPLLSPPPAGGQKDLHQPQAGRIRPAWQLHRS
jgi:hypothetical protein